MVGSPYSPRDSQESSPHHSSKASILWRSAFFIVQVSHPYMTTGKIIAWTRWTFVGKVMSLLFNMLSRLVREELKQRMWGKFPQAPNLPRPRGDMLQLGYKTTWPGALLSCANQPVQPLPRPPPLLGSDTLGHCLLVLITPGPGTRQLGTALCPPKLFRLAHLSLLLLV